MIAGGGILGEFEAMQGKRGWRKSCEVFQYGEKGGRMSTGLISRRCTTSSEALEIWPDVWFEETRTASFWRGVGRS